MVPASGSFFLLSAFCFLLLDARFQPENHKPCFRMALCRPDLTESGQGASQDKWRNRTGTALRRSDKNNKKPKIALFSLCMVLAGVRASRMQGSVGIVVKSKLDIYISLPIAYGRPAGGSGKHAVSGT